jgi:Fur family ferric uptake transcriptional regulator
MSMPQRAAASPSPWDGQPDPATRRKLQAAKLRLTPQRCIVLVTLRADSEHFIDAEALQAATVRAGHGVTLSSVYRILCEFERAGIVHCIHLGARTLFRAVGEGGARPQFVCTGCGQTAPLGDETVLARLVELAGQRGFVLTQAFTLAAACTACRAQSGRP